MDGNKLSTAQCDSATLPFFRPDSGAVRHAAAPRARTRRPSRLLLRPGPEFRSGQCATNRLQDRTPFLR